MANVKVITERIASLSYEQADKLGISLFPVNIIYKDEVIHDDNDEKANKFLKDLPTFDEIPSTAVPPVGEMYEFFKHEMQDTDEGIYIAASSKLSGIYDAGLKVSDMLKKDGKTLKVFDSYGVVSIEGMYAYEAQNFSNEGKNLDDIFNHLEKLKNERMVVEYGVIETLKYLEKNGRIGKGKAWLANLFSFKPIISAKDGVLEPIAKVRTHDQGLEKIVTQIKTDIDRTNAKNIEVMLDFSISDEYLHDKVIPRLREEFNPKIISINQVSIVIACHLGPTIWGVCVKLE